MGKSILKQLKENERETRRILIINAAKLLFKKRPFHEIGMRTIATEAGISVASLYQYFPSQDDLFVEILKYDFQFIKKKLWQVKVTLEEISFDIVDFFIEHEDIFQMMSHFMLHGEKNPGTLKKFNETQQFFHDLLDTTLTRHNPELKETCCSKAFFTALFGNVITFRNATFPANSNYKESLYEIVKVTANAFQGTFDSKSKLQDSA